MSVNLVGSNLLVTIPPELVYHIVEHVYDDTRTLLSCALVSHSWVRAAQRHLYSSVTVKGLSTQHDRHDIPSFLYRLNKFQAIGSYVVHLVIQSGICGLSELFVVISKLTRLRTLTIDTVYILPFISLPSQEPPMPVRELSLLNIKRCKIIYANGQPSGSGSCWHSLFDLIAMFSSIESMCIAMLETQRNPPESCDAIAPQFPHKTQVKRLSCFGDFGGSVATFVECTTRRIDMGSITSLLMAFSYDQNGSFQRLIDLATGLQRFTICFGPEIGQDRHPTYNISLASCKLLECVHVNLSLTHPTWKPRTGSLSTIWKHGLAFLSSLPRQSTFHTVNFTIIIRGIDAGTITPECVKLESLEWNTLEDVLNPFRNLKRLHIYFVCPVPYAGSWAFVKDELLAGLARRFKLHLEWKISKK